MEDDDSVNNPQADANRKEETKSDTSRKSFCLFIISIEYESLISQLSYVRYDISIGVNARNPI